MPKQKRIQSYRPGRPAMELLIYPLISRKVIFRELNHITFFVYSDEELDKIGNTRLWTNTDGILSYGQSSCFLLPPNIFDLFGVTLIFLEQYGMEEVVNNSIFRITISNKRYFEISPLHPILFNIKPKLLDEMEFSVYLDYWKSLEYKKIYNEKGEEDFQMNIDQLKERASKGSYFDLSIDGLPIPMVSQQDFRITLETFCKMFPESQVVCILYGVLGRPVL